MENFPQNHKRILGTSFQYQKGSVIPVHTLCLHSSLHWAPSAENVAASAAGWSQTDFSNVMCQNLRAAQNPFFLPSITVMAGQSITQISPQCALHASKALETQNLIALFLRLPLKMNPRLWIPFPALCRGHKACISGSKPLENTQEVVIFQSY